MKVQVACDIEIFPNYLLVGFKRLEDGKKLSFETTTSLDRSQRKTLKNVLQKYQVITFNGIRYDIPMLYKVLEGANVQDLFSMSETIVKEKMANFQIINRFGLEPFEIDHIDISEPSPAVFVSLKGYGARLHSQRLQDLPYPYDKYLTDEEMEEIKRYNENDLDTTIDLYNAIKPRIDLRVEMSKEYKTDLRSKSDAQIAEAVIIKELQRAGVTVERPQMPKSVRYVAPDCVSFESDVLNELLNGLEATTFKINPKNGQPVLPDWLKKFDLQIGDTKYQVGVGGLHSKEKKLVVLPKLDEILGNIDVASYYPSMILEFMFYPKRFTSKFIDVYRAIYERRLKAKAEQKRLEKILDTMEHSHNDYADIHRKYILAKTINEGLKIVLNGSFGKLGSMYSKLYAPDLMLQVTLTGQLMLLMLIERLEKAGIAVKSSNTDGVEFLCPKFREVELDAIVFDWELATGMVMEHGRYNGLYARDVNNYVAVYDGETKAKGVYAEPTLQKNSEYPIVFTSIREYLLNGTPLEETIRKCTDITQFLTSRTVKGGGVWREDYLGKVVRWYYAVDGDTIHYQSNGNKVPKSDGARPMMDIGNSDVLQRIPPSDLDHNKYIELAIGHLEDLGVSYVDS